LLAAGRIPPVVAVFLGNVPGIRTIELTCNDVFIEFVTSELIPWLRRSYTVTDDPNAP